MKKQLIYILFILILSPTVTWAASHYIRSGASGSSCADWGTNACNALPSSLVRGDTYYIANGSYAGRTFNTAASGTSTITIKGATAADHGTDTGWSNSYSVSTSDGGSQAIWTSGIIIGTSYWIFDGSVGPTWSKTVSQYGFAFSSITKPIRIYNLSSAINYITIAHVAATAPASDVEKFFISTDNSTQQVQHVTVSHCYGNGWQNFWWAMAADAYWTCEYNMVLNGFSSATNHGEDINNNYSTTTNLIVRYTWFEGRSAGTGVIVANNANINSSYIYGNIFYNNRAGNGIITGTSAGSFSNSLIYNNTFAGNNASDCGPIVGGPGSGNQIYNNILYNNNNNSLNGTSVNNSTYSSSPFISLGTNFHLSSATPAGTTFASSYNIDPDGNTRGADGVWDRGAYEFGGNSIVIRPNPPVLH